MRTAVKASAVELLCEVAQQAYLHNPGNCSGAVHDVIRKLVNPAAPYRLANALMGYLANPANGWSKVRDYAEASALADRGVVVVGGLAEPGGHGHVIVVLPGRWRPSGGYKVDGRLMPSHGMFPPAMSTSLGPWPGAVSDGDKTVFDPWDNVQVFKHVTFWAWQKKS
ncbi:hypothetical protein AruPA_03365 [Acidiphilium sp. PA]|uniref:hypothetical protein n=1 Tax=Acidiphilium sp. PA TaxID=2871705 RepID=UPI002243AF4B|nr:hypothetical protein [Acidiphilium sp. PA]MCW8306066.1 hypothetical protein [Acidiphilium sp. PA]